MTLKEAWMEWYLINGYRAVPSRVFDWRETGPDVHAQLLWREGYIDTSGYGYKLKPLRTTTPEGINNEPH